MIKVIAFNLVVLFTFLCTPNVAQHKLLTIDEAVMGQYREFYPKSLFNLSWRGAAGKISYQDSRFLYETGTRQLDSAIVCSAEIINAALKTHQLDTLQRLPILNWLNDNELQFNIPGYCILFNVSTKKITNLIAIHNDAANVKPDNKYQQVAFTIDNNIFISNKTTSNRQITFDTNKDIVNGDFVSRNEFGINDGLFWSPDGNLLAFYRKDNSKVKSYPLVDITAREAEVQMIKYPMAGMPSEHVSLGVFDIASGNTVFIERNDTVSEKYLTNIAWSPDEKYIYIAVLNRAQNHMKLNRYLALDGSLDKTLFEEKHEKYVEPQFPLQFVPDNPDWFIWQSRRDGFNHLYLYDTNGTMLQQLTSGAWEVISLLGFDNKNQLYYQSTEPDPTQRHIFKINIKNAKRHALTNIPGTHEAVLNKHSGAIIDKFTSTSIANAVSIISADGKKAGDLLNAPNPLRNYKMPEMQIGTIKAADGVTDLYFRLIKPVDFDSTKKYPVIVYVYGGPHLQLVTNEWLGGAYLWEHYMAQNGYLMFCLDNRGSANRGLAFENIIHRQCGVNEIKDQMQGIAFLKSLGYVDMQRVGVHGWSYGGFMTTSLMVNYSDVFKAGVAGGPVIDWKYYEVMYGERYMDTPEENPEGYIITSPLTKVKQLKGDLLIIHGAVDPVVVWQNSLVFINECIKNKVQVDYFVYPLSEHNVRGIDRVHLMQKVTDYFDQNLK